jgi:ABC-2 type transport system permease protein
MKRILHLIRKEFLQIGRDRAMLALLFMVPLIQLILLGYAVSSDVRAVKLAVCDRDDSELSRGIVDRFRHCDTFSLRLEDDRPEEMGRALDDGRASIALIIPEGFAAGAAAAPGGGPLRLQILLDGQDSNTSTIALGYSQGILEDALRSLAAAGGGPAPRALVPDIRVRYNEDLKMSHYMIPGIIVFLLTMVTALLSAMGLVREKEIGTYEQLLVSPLKKHEILIGKIIPYSAVGFVELVLAVAFARFWYGIPIAGNLGWFGLNVLIFLFTTLGIGLLVSSVAGTQQQAMFLTMFFLFFFLIMSGFMFPIENMPPVMRMLTFLDPMRYLLTCARETFIKGSGPRELMTQTAALTAFGAAIFSFAVWRFQNKIR